MVRFATAEELRHDACRLLAEVDAVRQPPSALVPG